MATKNIPVSMQPNDIPAPAQSYQQAMQNLNSVVIASPQPNGVVMLVPQQLTTVNTQAGQHYKVRRRGDNNLQTPDNVVAVRHGDALHLRYADGSAVSFENFYAICTTSSECSVDVAGDNGQSIALSGANPSNGIAADDGLLVYAHGEHDVLMTMAQDQAGLSSAILGMGGAEEVTYLPPGNQAVALALGALAIVALASSNTSSSGANVGLSGGATSAGDERTRALAAISSAADNNSAASTITSAGLYAAAGVSGVTAGNLAAINSALDSKAITGANAGTAAQVQTIVDAYNAILSSADGRSGNTGTPLTAAQYAAIGVTGVSGTSIAGSALGLLDSTIDGSTAAAVGNEASVQAMADAATRILAVAATSGTPANPLRPEDFTALGIAGVTSDNLAAIQATIQSTPANGVDTQPELQFLVNTKLGAIGAALNTIAAAAEADNAKPDTLDLNVYAAAGVSDVTTTNLSAINSALNSKAINAAAADTTAEVQAIVNAYKAILASADGTSGNTTPPLTAAQYNAIGVTGMSGTPTSNPALSLLDSVVDAIPIAGVMTEGQVQFLADAANKVMSAAGGTPSDIAALTINDLQALGVSGVTADNLPAVIAAIGKTTPDSAIDTLDEIRKIATTAEGAAADALVKISTAAGSDKADASTPSLNDYAAAGVTGVGADNQMALSSALNSLPVNAAATNTTAEVQGIVNAYNAILASADGKGGNTATPLTAAQYTAVGVTGVSGSPDPGTALFVLDGVVDGKVRTDVDTIQELQALANAANHLVAAAGGQPADIAALTLDDLKALGVTGVTADNLPAVAAAIGKTTPDTAIDTPNEIQAVATAAEMAAAAALVKISTAAGSDKADSSTPSLADYAAAGIAGVGTNDQSALISALNSGPVNAAATDTTAEVQSIVNAYNAILASADGKGGNTDTPLTGAQYTAVGVTGVSGSSQPGNALHLLDSVVDASGSTLVDTVPELQFIANAAAHVISGAAGGAAPSLDDLNALGIVGVTDANLLSVQNAIANTADNGTGVDTQAALQIIVNGAVNSHPIISSVLGGVTNLDVSSDLVFNANQTVTLGTGFIHITDKGGSNGGTGYQNDTNTNNQDIDVANAVKSGLLSISGTGANTKIIINPQWDLDLSSNYQISIDDTVFRNADGTQAAVHFAPITFSTVTPGTHTTGTAASEAVASQTMNDNTGLLVASKSWLDVQGIGNNTGSVAQLGTLSGGAFALVMKNYATTPGGANGDQTDGMAAHDTFVGFTNFGADDVVYLDSQVNNSAIQLFDGKYTPMTDGGNQTGGLTGQNALVFGEVSTPMQHGNQAMVLLGLEGNTANTIYTSIYTFDANTIGWANVWHPLTAPVVMG